jgi:antitoxin component YwqK of YwqJK toxin-antitoxin module
MKKRLIKFILWFSGTLLLFTGAFFILNHQLYNGRLTDSDDGITVLQNITLDKISSTDIVGNDSIWVMREDMEAEANGIIIDTMGNYNGVILNGLKQGKWRYFYPNNRKLAEVYYIDGYYGKHLRYVKPSYSDQTPTKENVPLSIISEVGLNSKCIFWYVNGQLLKAQNYKDGKRFENGVYKEWDYNGEVKLEQEFQDGKAQGFYREWYSNLLIEEGHYLDDRKEGIWKEYSSGYGTYTKGAIIFEGVYSQGIFVSRKTYHQNGRLQEERIWDENLLMIIKSWHDNGELRGIEHYKCDDEMNNRPNLPLDNSGIRFINLNNLCKRHGSEKYWNREGFLELKTNWLNGKKHGDLVTYYYGELYDLTRYSDGKEIFYKKYAKW